MPETPANATSPASCFAPWCGIDGHYGNPGVCNAPGGHKYKTPGGGPELRAHSSPPGPATSSAARRGRLGLDLPERQNVDEVVRDLVSDYPGTVACSAYPSPDYGVVRLNRLGSDWIVTVARAEITDD